MLIGQLGESLKVKGLSEARHNFSNQSSVKYEFLDPIEQTEQAFACGNWSSKER